MRAIAPSLVVASSAIVLVLGLLHLLYTFRGRKLHPRDPDLHVRMNEVSPVITRQRQCGHAGSASTQVTATGSSSSASSTGTWRSRTARSSSNPLSLLLGLLLLIG